MIKIGKINRKEPPLFPPLFPLGPAGSAAQSPLPLARPNGPSPSPHRGPAASAAPFPPLWAHLAAQPSPRPLARARRGRLSRRHPPRWGPLVSRPFPKTASPFLSLLSTPSRTSSSPCSSFPSPSPPRRRPEPPPSTPASPLAVNPLPPLPLAEREMCPWAISKCFGDLESNTSA
jgi:hypothetical protein